MAEIQSKKITRRKLIDYLEIVGEDFHNQTYDVPAIVNFLIDMDLLNLERVNTDREEVSHEVV